MYVNNTKLTLQRHLIYNLILNKNQCLKLTISYPEKKTKRPNIMIVLLVLFSAFWCFFVLVKSYCKKNKKFKTDLITLFILLLVRKIFRKTNIFLSPDTHMHMY